MTPQRDPFVNHMPGPLRRFAAAAREAIDAKERRVEQERMTELTRHLVAIFNDCFRSITGAVDPCDVQTDNGRPAIVREGLTFIMSRVDNSFIELQGACRTCGGPNGLNCIIHPHSAGEHLADAIKFHDHLCDPCTQKANSSPLLACTPQERALLDAIQAWKEG